MPYRCKLVPTRTPTILKKKQKTKNTGVHNGLMAFRVERKTVRQTASKQLQIAGKPLCEWKYFTFSKNVICTYCLKSNRQEVKE